MNSLIDQQCNDLAINSMLDLSLADRQVDLCIFGLRQVKQGDHVVAIMQHSQHEQEQEEFVYA